MKSIDHIGIAVRDMAGSNELFRKLLGEAYFKIETVESEKVATSFFHIGESKIASFQLHRYLGRWCGFRF